MFLFQSTPECLGKFKRVAAGETEQEKKILEENFIEKATPYWGQGKMIPDWKILRQAFSMSEKKDQRTESRERKTISPIDLFATLTEVNNLLFPFLDENYPLVERLLSGVDSDIRIEGNFFSESIPYTHLAAAVNSVPLLQLFLTKDPSDIWDSHMAGITLLMTAAAYGAEDVLIYLIGKGADVDKVNDAGETALILAVRQSHLKSAQILVGAGADFTLGRNLKVEEEWDDFKEVVSELKERVEQNVEVEYLLESLNIIYFTRRSQEVFKMISGERIPLLETYQKILRHLEKTRKMMSIIKNANDNPLLTIVFPDGVDKNYKDYLFSLSDFRDNYMMDLAIYLGGTLEPESAYTFDRKELIAEGLFFLERFLEKILPSRQTTFEESLLNRVSPSRDFLLKVLGVRAGQAAQETRSHRLLISLSHFYYRPGGPGYFEAVESKRRTEVWK